MKLHRFSFLLGAIGFLMTLVPFQGSVARAASCDSPFFAGTRLGENETFTQISFDNACADGMVTFSQQGGEETLLIDLAPGVFPVMRLSHVLLLSDGVNFVAIKTSEDASFRTMGKTIEISLPRESSVSFNAALSPYTNDMLSVE